MIAENASTIVGRSIAHYKVLSVLGRGGMGHVYLAHDTKLGRRVALKLISTDNKHRIRRFEVEARSASALNHPNVCVIHEIGQTDDGRNFIAMEHIDGETLRRHLADGPLPPREAIEIALQIASALTAAHRAGVVHRDIKPENVMLRPDGYVKVLDFGLAKLTERSDLICDTDVPTLPASGSGVLIGTINYLSPEQARAEEVDERTDIWSLGVVLYEMLTGSLPFKGQTPSHAVVAILESEPVSLMDFSPKIPAELDWILKKALRKDRRQRYQSAEEFASDLRQLKKNTLSVGGELTRPIIPKRQASRIPIVIAALLLAAIAVGFVLVKARRENSAPTLTNIDSLAVLPFTNSSSDPEMDYLSDGITDTLINNLSQLPNVKVIGRNSVFRYKGQQTTAQTVGADLNVKAVLTGRIVEVGNEVSISVVLENATDNTHIWGAQYNRKLSDIFAIQDEISRLVTEKLSVRISEDDRRRLAQRATSDVEAYQLYLKGRWFWNQRTGEGRRQALACFEKAIGIDPKYALAYAGLADIYALTGGPPEESYAKAKAAATKALELDATLGEAHATLGFIKSHYELDWTGADAEFKRAIELKPNYATAHHWYADQLQVQGHFDQALNELQRAAELDPFSPIISIDTGAIYFFKRDYDKAIELLRASSQRFPDFWAGHYYLAWAYTQKKMYPEALSEYQQAANLSRRHSMVVAMTGYTEAMRGRRIEALKVLKELKDRSSREYVPPLRFAIVYTALGDKDKAFEWLNTACDRRDILVIYLKINPFFDTLRNDPRFPIVLQRLNLA